MQTAACNRYGKGKSIDNALKLYDRRQDAFYLLS